MNDTNNSNENNINSMDTPLVSVIVITYNQEDVLHKALASILMQETTFSYEIIVGEDCSTDNSKKILAEYESKESKIKVIYNIENNVKDSINSIDSLKIGKISVSGAAFISSFILPKIIMEFSMLKKILVKTAKKTANE